MKNKGFSLIELMICLVLSALIIIGLMNMIIKNKFQHQEQSLELQLENNLSYAKNYLERAIRNAGYVGCTNADWLGAQTLTGTKNTVALSYADPIAYYLTEEMKNPAEELPIRNEFKSTTHLVISDCKTADFFSPLKENHYAMAHAAFQKSYKVHAEIAKWNIVNFYVDKTQRKDNEGHAIFALYSKNVGEDRQEIVDHIVAIDLSYGSSLNSFDMPLDFKTVKIIKVSLQGAIPFQKNLIKKDLVFFVTLRNRVG